MTDTLAAEPEVFESIEQLRLHEAAYEDGDAMPALEMLYLGLLAIRECLDEDVWRVFCQKTASARGVSELRSLLPIGSRCHAKPAGMSADPVAMDWICNASHPTGANRILLDWERSRPSARSIQARRDQVAKELEDCFRAVRKPRVLSVGNGHIREAQDVLPWFRISGGDFLAFDSNRDSLSVVDRVFGRHGVQSIQGPLAMLQSEDHGLGLFDFIYALNTLDLLKSSDAQSFLKSLAAMLKPGGTLLVANFTPDLQDSAYLEAVMDWWPVYRTEEDMAELTAAIPDEYMTGHVVYRDQPGHIVYLEIQR